MLTAMENISLCLSVKHARNHGFPLLLSNAAHMRTHACTLSEKIISTKVREAPSFSTFPVFPVLIEFKQFSRESDEIYS